MRSDRRREIMMQLEEEKKAEKKNVANGFCRFISVLYTMLAIAFVALLWWLDVLPEKYFYGGIAVLVIAWIFIVPVMFSKHGKKGRKIGATVVALLLIGAFGVGTYYMVDTLDFLGNITDVGQAKDDYYVIVKSEPQGEAPEQSEGESEDISILTGQIIGTYMANDLSYSEAKAMLQEKVQVEYAYEENATTTIEKLLSGDYTAVFMSAATFEGLKNGETTASLDLANSTKVLYTVSVPIEVEDQTSAVDVTKDSFNVYITGLDVQGSIDVVSRSDVNMIATVNPNTHQVLLTSIPRDYYVILPSKQSQDKLTHSGLYGVQESIGALEELLGIDINYYVKVNYSTVVKLVDALGGIDIDSPYAFSTHGMSDLGLNGINFVKGSNHLDGRKALAYSRERKSWSDGDMRRNENQQMIMEAILKKATSSTTILTKYTSILSAIEENMQTNMSQEEMSSIVKMQLDGMPGWKIKKHAIKGIPGYDFCYALGYKASIVAGVKEEEMKAVDDIIKVHRGHQDNVQADN